MSSRYRGDFADRKMILHHAREVERETGVPFHPPRGLKPADVWHAVAIYYDKVSGGRISKPQTLPYNVVDAWKDDHSNLGVPGSEKITIDDVVKAARYRGIGKKKMRKIRNLK